MVKQPIAWIHLKGVPLFYSDANCPCIMLASDGWKETVTHDGTYTRLDRTTEENPDMLRGMAMSSDKLKRVYTEAELPPKYTRVL